MSKQQKQTLSLSRPLTCPGLVVRAKISTCNEAINDRVTFRFLVSLKTSHFTMSLRTILIHHLIELMFHRSNTSNPIFEKSKKQEFSVDWDFTRLLHSINTVARQYPQYSITDYRTPSPPTVLLTSSASNLPLVLAANSFSTSQSSSISYFSILAHFSSVAKRAAWRTAASWIIDDQTLLKRKTTRVHGWKSPIQITRFAPILLVFWKQLIPYSHQSGTSFTSRYIFGHRLLQLTFLLERAKKIDFASITRRQSTPFFLQFFLVFSWF